MIFDLRGQVDRICFIMLLAAAGCSRDGCGPSQSAAERQQLFANKLGISKVVSSNGGSLILIPPGRFRMGAVIPTMQVQDSPVHTAEISAPFYMGVTEVSQRQFTDLMGYNPSCNANQATVDHGHNIAVEDFPVEHVTWFDAIEFCNLLSKTDGFTPYYDLSEVVRSGTKNERVHPKSIISGSVLVKGGQGYRLPTEAEWEYACQYGCASGNAAEYCWIIDRFEVTTFPVGLKTPNAFGLYDMLGNVGEWCEDGYSILSYSAGNRIDPIGQSWAPHRVVRGIPVCHHPNVKLHHAHRSGCCPDLSDWVGIRLVRFIPNR